MTTEEKPLVAPPAKVNQAEIDRILAEVEADPENTGFNKMFQHNSAAIPVIVVGVIEKKAE